MTRSTPWVVGLKGIEMQNIEFCGRGLLGGYESIGSVLIFHWTMLGL